VIVTRAVVAAAGLMGGPAVAPIPLAPALSFSAPMLSAPSLIPALSAPSAPAPSGAPAARPELDRLAERGWIACGPWLVVLREGVNEHGQKIAALDALDAANPAGGTVGHVDLTFQGRGMPAVLDGPLEPKGAARVPPGAEGADLSHRREHLWFGLGVAPSWRERGLGGVLMGLANGLAAREGAGEMIIYATESSRGFYLARFEGRVLADEPFTGADEGAYHRLVVKLPAAPSVELVHAPAPSLFDKTSVAEGLKAGLLSYGAELATPNPVSAATAADGGGISAVFIDGAKAERGTISGLVNALSRSNAIVIGRFASAADPFLKPKLDEGLLGASLENASSLKETLRFLRKTYLPPLGRRSVGPSDVTRYLGAVKDFVARSNGVFLGGVTIGTAEGVAKIGSILKAAARGLRFVEVGPGLSAEQAAKVEEAAREAGVALVGRASSRDEALLMRARGYRHVIITGDERAVDAAFVAYEDVPRDAAREPALGAFGFLMSPDVPLARRLAAGAGGLWIDGEDGHFTLSQIRELIAAVPERSIVRATGFDNPDIPAYLAAGAAGVIAPQVSTAREAAEFVATVKRGNPDASAIVMIENKEAMRHLEEIVRVPGIDVLFIGPYDLALSLNLAPDSAEFKAAIARIEAAARAAGVPLGGLSKSRSETYRLKALGYEFVATVSDQGAIADGIKKTLGPAFAAAGY
jgi:4-hydroxy-2-oxoheptanedioate aldolase